MPINQEVISVKDFMSMLSIKSQTTFNKRCKDEGFPAAIEWPPKSKNRGWYRCEAEAYVNDLMANAKPWSEVTKD